MVVKVTYLLSGKPKPPLEIKERALRHVNKEKYNLFVRNCEHFATWCVYGKAVSGHVRAAAAATAVVAGAAVGATLGSIIPGAGTVTGAAIGASVGLAGSALGLGITIIQYEVNNEENEFD